MNRKHVICIGAQRTSTTRLYECLKKHPDIFVPDEKELHYFNAVLPPYNDSICLTQPFLLTRIFIKYLLNVTDFYSKNMHGARKMRKKLLRGRSVPEYYWGKFRNKDLISCDITPAYSLLNEEGVALISKTAPESKIIFILRDPIERLWSEVNYFHNKRGVCLEKRLNDPVFINKLLKGAHHQRRADYATIHQLYSKYFTDVMILVFEEINESINENMKKICDFIGINSSSDYLNYMPLEKKINASEKITIPESLETRLLESQSDNYKKNIEYFGKQISGWRYYDYFNHN